MYYNDDSVLFFDGEYVKAKEAKTDLYGQSLHYGYAVFKVLNPTEQPMEPKFLKQKNITTD